MYHKEISQARNLKNTILANVHFKDKYFNWITTFVLLTNTFLNHEEYRWIIQFILLWSRAFP